MHVVTNRRDGRDKPVALVSTKINAVAFLAQAYSVLLGGLRLLVDELTKALPQRNPSATPAWHTGLAILRKCKLQQFSMREHVTRAALEMQVEEGVTERVRKSKGFSLVRGEAKMDTQNDGAWP